MTFQSIEPLAFWLEYLPLHRTEEVDPML